MTDNDAPNDAGGSASNLVEASAEAVAGAAAGSVLASLLGVSSVAGGALFPLAGAVALPLFILGVLRRKANR
jgi:hypothetical protein